uniref:Putative secreted protein n=1 Tax=Ixodes ricinus TaxID=34613 RepID=A0A6B0UTQ1_IXORI
MLFAFCSSCLLATIFFWALAMPISERGCRDGENTSGGGVCAPTDLAVQLLVVLHLCLVHAQHLLRLGDGKLALLQRHHHALVDDRLLFLGVVVGRAPLEEDLEQHVESPVVPHAVAVDEQLPTDHLLFGYHCFAVVLLSAVQ